MDATAKICLLTNYKNKDGLFTVKLRIIHDRTPKYYSINKYLKNKDWNYCLSKEELNDILKKTSRASKKDARLNYEKIEQIAENIIGSLTQFSFNKFEEIFLNKLSNWDYVANAFEEHIQSLKDNDEHGYSISMHSSYTAIKYFAEKKEYPRGVQGKDYANFKNYKKLKFIDITPDWLTKFERFLLNNGKSISTIGVYTRNIRVLFNIAINDHNIKAEYPFIKYKPKTSSNKKRALNIEQIKLIAGYKAINGSPEMFARDMFVFSFLANGMNITDIFRLKYKNIIDDEIQFSRFKTKNKDKKVNVQVALTSNLRQIIKRHGNIAISEDVFIFPVATGTKEDDIFRLIKQKNKTINKYLKKIAKEVDLKPEIANNISTYYARHSFATILKNSGESIEYIKESLGHSSSVTTEKYLSSFDIDYRKKTSDNLDRLIFNS